MEIGSNPTTPTGPASRTTSTAPATPNAKSAPTEAPAAANSAQRLTQVGKDFSNEQAIGLSPLPNAGGGGDELFTGQGQKKAEAERLDQELRRAYEHQHPDQLKRDKDGQASVTRQTDLRYADKATRRQAIEQEQALANQRYQAAQLKASTGWAQEEQNLKAAQRKLNDSQGKMEHFLTPETRQELDAHLQLRERAKTVGQPGGPSAEEFKTQVESGQQSLMSKLGRKDGFSLATDGQQQLKRLLADHDGVQKAKNFPVTSQEKGAWMEARLAERNAALGAASEKLRGLEKGYAGDRDKITSDAAAANAAADQKLTAQLQTASDKAHSVSWRDLKQPVRSSEAMSGQYGDGRSTPDGGVEFRSADGKTTQVSIRETGDKKITVSADRPDRASQSVLTPAGDGRYTESSKTTSYQTSGQPGAAKRGDFKEEVTLRKDADGHEVYRHSETPGKNGTRELRTTTNEDGVSTHKAETMLGDKVLRTYSTRNETINGKKVETTDLSDADSTHHSVKESRNNGTSTETSDWKSKDYERHRVTHTGKDGTVTYHEKTKTNDPANPGSGSESMETRPDGSAIGKRSSKAKDFESHTDISVKNGKTTETEVAEYKDIKNTVTSVTVDGKLQSERSVQKVKADPDVPGLGWIGSQNAQDLVEKLHDRDGESEDGLRAEKITEKTLGADGKMAVRESSKLISEDGSRELVQGTGANGGNMWTYRKQNGDGTWNSQTFFQGTKDTIVNTTRKEGDFQIQEEKADTRELAKNSDVPASSRARIHTSDAASVESVSKMLSGHQMADVSKVDAFKDFMRENGDGKLKVMAEDGSSKLEGGLEKHSGKLVLESGNGRRLTAVYDDEKKTYMVQNESKEGKEPPQLSILNGKDRLEFSKTGTVSELKDDKMTWTKPANQLEEGSGNVKKSVDTVQDSANSVAWISKKLADGDPGKVAKFAGTLGDGHWSGRIGVGVGKGAAALSGLSLAADIANGDWGRVTEKGAGLGTDVAELVQTLEERAGPAARSTAGAAAGEGAAAARFGWVSTGARVLGVAGVVTGAVLAGKDISEGKYTRAALGITGATAGGYALFGAASFAGPLGWGVAGAAGLATMAWDYNEGTKIADLAI